MTLPEQLTFNGAGEFDVGSPEGDNGLSGKKLVMQACSPGAPIGGGAWSGPAGAVVAATGKDYFED